VRHAGPGHETPSQPLHNRRSGAEAPRSASRLQAGSTHTQAPAIPCLRWQARSGAQAASGRLAGRPCAKSPGRAARTGTASLPAGARAGLLVTRSTSGRPAAAAGSTLPAPGMRDRRPGERGGSPPDWTPGNPTANEHNEQPRTQCPLNLRPSSSECTESLSSS
jgi:hypothetical protein